MEVMGSRIFYFYGSKLLWEDSTRKETLKKQAEVLRCCFLDKLASNDDDKPHVVGTGREKSVVL